MNCKSQSHDAKYVCGLPTVKTCYVFAIINAIVVNLAVLGLLGCLSLLVYLTVSYGADWILSGILVTTLVAAGGYVTLSIAAIFAILLLFGIRKKNPKLVKAYLVYGIVVEILLILALIVGTAVFLDEIFRVDVGAISFAILLCSCVFYGFVLHLVKNTYVVLRNSSSLRANRTDVQALFMLGPDGELQVLPLVG